MSRQGVRIGAGRFKGRVLPVAPGVRPTGSRVREALFDLLGPRLPGARFLDLFAGSGGVGVEAASRGASEVVLADGSERVVRGLRRGVGALGEERLRVVRLRLPGRPAASAAALGAPFDIVFADPPYRFDDCPGLLRLAAELLAPGGVLVVEHAASERLPEAGGGLALADRRCYGDSCLSFYAPASGVPPADSQFRK